MNKKVIIWAIIIIILAGMIYWIYGVMNKTNNPAPAEQEQAADPKDSTFLIEGKTITLKNGLFSDSKATIRYFGNKIISDFNNDSKDDIAFIITSENDRSDISYYLTALLSIPNGYQGVEAALIGNNIGLQNAEYRNDEIVVTYLDRKSGDPATAAPSITATKYFSVTDNQIQEITRNMSEVDARIIAEASCIKGGEYLGTGTYDNTTKSWRFSANLNTTRSGCVPICAVDIETKTARIEWQCGDSLNSEGNGDTACTMEAKICPDGTEVGRIGPTCEFAPCPEESSGRETACPDNSRDNQICGQIYDPVCALLQVDCIKAPCEPIKQTFPNSCAACSNERVKSYLKGECPD